MKAVVTEDAHVLTPNMSHKNFTRTPEIIPKNTELEGEIKVIKGLKRGEPFEYNLFYTNDDRIIYIKNIKPMQRTEVTLGADKAISSTKIDLPTTSNLGMFPIAGALVGAGLAYYFAKKRGVTTHHTKVIYVAIGGLVGFAAGKYIQSKRSITVKPAK